MNTNFYITFSTGLIDGLLVRTKTEPYVINIDGKWHKDNTKKESLKMGLDEYLYRFLSTKDLIPSIDGKLNYEVEYTSPFNETVSRLLLVLKYVAGRQLLNNNQPVTITNGDLAELGFHQSTLEFKKAFDRYFWNSCVTNNYESGKWIVKIGPRDLRTHEGPGSIKLKLSNYQFLFTKIMDLHHQEYNTKNQK